MGGRPRLAYLTTDRGIAYGGTKGAAVHVGEITAALAGRGVDVLVLVAAVAPGATPPPGVTVEVLPGAVKGGSIEGWLAGEPARAAWLAERLARFDPVCLHERFALHSAAGSVAARQTGVPHLVELNAPLVDEAARYRTLEHPDEARRLERAVLAAADVVLPVSRPLADHARALGAQVVEVLPNAVAIDDFPAPPTRPPGSPLTAVLSGTLRPWHGVEVVAEAWPLMGADAPRLLVVGDGPGRRALEKAGAEVTGAVDHAQVPALLQRADIGIAPYTADGPRYFSPLKVFEYLAAGLAVVAADLPGVTDVVDEQTAVLMPAGSAPALATAVADLVADPERRRALGRAGRSLVAGHHTWDHRARRVLELAGWCRASAAAATPGR